MSEKEFAIKQEGAPDLEQSTAAGNGVMQKSKANTYASEYRNNGIEKSKANTYASEYRNDGVDPEGAELKETRPMLNAKNLDAILKDPRAAVGKAAPPEEKTPVSADVSPAAIPTNEPAQAAQRAESKGSGEGR